MSRACTLKRRLDMHLIVICEDMKFILYLRIYYETITVIVEDHFKSARVTD